jgi:hypothetical protein
MQALKRVVAVGLLLLGGWAATSAPLAWGQEEINRKPKSKVAPVYPELARRMNITGVVKIQVTVAANGTIKNTKLVGAPGVGERRYGCGQEVAFRGGPGRVNGHCGIPFRSDPVSGRRRNRSAG